MKPNILLIMTDQHRYDCTGYSGNRVIETPNLDFLASQGTIFENAYTPSPSCIPARACLISGMNQWNCGILGMGGGQSEMGVGFKHTLPGELAKGGYQTQGVGKMHFFPQRALNGFHNTVLDESGRAQQGFVSDYRQWFNANKTGDYDISDHGIGWNSWMSRPYHAPEFLHPTNWTVGEAMKFLDRRDPSMPFFMKLSFARPHSPYDAPACYFEKYLTKELPKADVGDWASINDVPEDALNPDAWRGVRSDEDIRYARAGYYGSITHIDHQLGRLFYHMRKAKAFDNTMIIFTSDHGDMLGDQNLWRKTYAYEPSAHIPFFIKLPKQSDSVVKRVSAPVSLYDIMPTVLDFAGVDIPETVDGMSLLPLMRGETQKTRAYIHGEHSTCYSTEQEMQYVTDGNYKFIWFPRMGREQFFDLTKDRKEMNDLISSGEYKALVELWRGRLVSELAKRDAGLTDNDRLVNQAGKPFHVSPKYVERKAACDYDWFAGSGKGTNA